MCVRVRRYLEEAVGAVGADAERVQQARLIEDLRGDALERMTSVCLKPSVAAAGPERGHMYDVMFQVVHCAAEVEKVYAISEPGESLGSVGAGKSCAAAAEVRARDADTTAFKQKPTRFLTSGREKY